MIDRDTVIALHEADHCVVARCLALRCGGAMVADGCGRADYHDDEEEHGSSPSSSLTWPALPPSSFLLAASPTASPVTGELIVAACAARGMTQDECDRLWRTACALVRANESAIRCVAVALQRRGRLSGAEIDAIAWPRARPDE